MARGIGIAGEALGVAVRQRLSSTTAIAGVPFVLVQPAIAGTATYRLYDANAPKRFRVIRVWGVMTGAGGAGDTVVVNDGANNITNVVSVAALADQDVWDAVQIDDAQHTVDKGGSLRVVTASDALSIVYIECIWT